ncbi:APC family permease [Salegentibacter flavus]|uniref:Amino acid transporter n=1 Tax=Salegentibacter flavus TaxID=287099 RepID=A0A1I5BCS7_9FLAO|nr:APC family permease [Salegentibacter flavus]SFN72538.1 Amino acid transporter [Salegentibacter flavus]
MSKSKQKQSTLARTISLKVALSIGVGIMVGAGIFVFPGIASGQAGPAAMLSFLLAGAIALIVALCTAELATAMPASGGGYYFVSRAFGPFWGILIGVGQWMGLVFASSFYLYGFASYLIDLLKETGLQFGDPLILIGIGTALLLTSINILGTKSAGKLQNSIVLVLTGILTLLFLYGMLQALGIMGATNLPKPFAPKGLSPVVGVTALIFTSYLGFVQIATVGGEIINPQKNLPRALVGSVLIVTALYLLALFVSNSVLSTAELGELGETAIVEVARGLIGDIGAMVVLFAGLLATLSSANASILSSSRTIFALSNDGLIPKWVSVIHERFKTPHRALFLVGLPITGIMFVGNLEVLAETASMLHLLIYGLICGCVLKLRKNRPIWYVPGFKSPAYPILPIVGLVASFGLIFFMRPVSLLLGGAVLLVSALFYLVYARGKTLATPSPSHIAPELRKPRILIPVSLPQKESLPLAILRSFTDLEVLVLGYKELPEQTDPGQYKDEEGDESKKQLEKVKKELEDEEFDVKTELVFTPDVSQAIDNVIVEHDCQALLVVKPISQLNRLLIPVYDINQLSKRFATVIYELTTASNLPASLLFLSGSKDSEDSEDKDGADISVMKREAISRLKQAGIHKHQIKTSLVEVANISDAVKEESKPEDLVILVEANANERETFINEIRGEISDKINCPLLVVLEKREKEEKQAEESPAEEQE